MPSRNGRRSNPPAAASTGSALPAPPPYKPTARGSALPAAGRSSGRSRQGESSGGGVGSDLPSHRRRGSAESGGSSGRRHGGNPNPAGSYRGGGAAVVTNQKGERVDTVVRSSSSRRPSRDGPLSPINVARAEGPSSGGESRKRETT